MCKQVPKTKVKTFIIIINPQQLRSRINKKIFVTKFGLKNITIIKKKSFSKLLKLVKHKLVQCKILNKIF